MKGRRGEGEVCDKYIYFSALSAHHLCVRDAALCFHVFSDTLCCGMSCQGGLQSGLLPIPGAVPDTTGQSKNLPLALKIRRKYCFLMK